MKSLFIMRNSSSKTSCTRRRRCNLLMTCTISPNWSNWRKWACSIKCNRNAIFTKSHLSCSISKSSDKSLFTMIYTSKSLFTHIFYCCNLSITFYTLKLIKVHFQLIWLYGNVSLGSFVLLVVVLVWSLSCSQCNYCCDD